MTDSRQRQPSPGESAQGAGDSERRLPKVPSAFGYEEFHILTTSFFRFAYVAE
jgi:hypothetical protein